MSQSTTEIRIVPLPTGQDVLTDLLRDGARRMLAQAVEAEVAAWIESHAHLKDEAGRRQVVRNGHLPERTIQTGLGDITSMSGPTGSTSTSAWRGGVSASWC